jgi:hypothetical protein
LNVNTGAAQNTEEGPEILARDVQETYEKVDDALADLLDDETGNAVDNALLLTVPAQYRALL